MKQAFWKVERLLYIVKSLLFTYYSISYCNVFEKILRVDAEI